MHTRPRTIRSYVKITAAMLIGLFPTVFGQGCSSGFTANPNTQESASLSQNENPPGNDGNNGVSDVTGGSLTLSKSNLNLVEGELGLVEMTASNLGAQCSLRVDSADASMIEMDKSAVQLAPGASTALTLQVKKLWGQVNSRDIKVQVDCGSGQAAKSIVVRALPPSFTLASGTHNACTIKTDRSAWCWGRGHLGQNGDNTTSDRSTPVKVAGGLKFSLIRAGTWTHCGLATDGKIYCWGRNMQGVQGNGDQMNRLVPTAVVGLPANADVVDVQLSNPFNLFKEHIKVGVSYEPNHACALLKNGDVWCWGDNYFGQLGLPAGIGGGTMGSNAPVKITGISGVTQISVGAAHTCAIKGSDQKIYCWGDNHAGQLGQGVSSLYSSAPALVDAANVKMVAAGGGFNCLLENSGVTKCWGRNTSRELGNGGTASPQRTPGAVMNAPLAVSIVAGDMNACVLTAEKKSYCWGDNYVGQLANGQKAGSSASAVAVEMPLVDPLSTLSIGTFTMCSRSQLTSKLQCWGHAYFGEAGNGVFFGEALTPQDVKF